jgi:hypothetical protein
MKHVLILVIILGALAVSGFSQENEQTKIVQLVMLPPYTRIGNEGSGALYFPRKSGHENVWIS